VKVVPDGRLRFAEDRRDFRTGISLVIVQVHRCFVLVRQAHHRFQCAVDFRGRAVVQVFVILQGFVSAPPVLQVVFAHVSRRADQPGLYMFLALEHRAGLDHPAECVGHGILGVGGIFHVAEAQTVDTPHMALVDVRNLFVRTQQRFCHWMTSLH
jgi:hypothetical protein